MWKWNGYGVCSNLASSGGPPPAWLLHVATLTTALLYALFSLGSAW